MEDTPGPGLRERKKRETRDELSRAAVELVGERGWAAVTIDDIAARAGVAPRTFRNYFPTKAAAISGRHVDRMRRVAEALAALPADVPLLPGLLDRVLAEFAQSGPGAPPPDPARIAAVRLMLAEPALQGELARAGALARDELAAAVAARTGTDPEREIYPHLVAAAVDSAVDVAITHCLGAARPVPLVPVLRDALERLTAGLAVPPAPEEQP
ncbi:MULTISPECIES: acyl-CoA-like ligand-binding transcription factor [Pseudonocardia]|uniref:HTH-type transcriptional regulator BetI n=2 Tax=Pseudonocardia TaxID=1847 RepID=A0A1Y2MUX2_PSEAH|nr:MULTISPECIES: TetR family transcriptional regulator [Pseudonocardia]OSY38951.1 HTH-type transcriptional regulator BetI [Pseudonocardia autotrophica]TDN76207.1 TetR family transcriptional regulator [Pseudonocardia autotrophica]BBG00189.1 TetR family transcriptional regulator [Pseudonocardia autotrophica]GEC26742.1 TetR family transcriptional regulator [Pseudonocardia saturnea]